MVCHLRESEPTARLCHVCADEIAEHALASEEDAPGCGCLDCSRVRTMAARAGMTADELTSLDVVVAAMRALRPRFELAPPANDGGCGDDPADDDLRHTIADEARDAWVEHLDAHADTWPEVAPMPWERDWTEGDALVGVAS